MFKTFLTIGIYSQQQVICLSLISKYFCRLLKVMNHLFENQTKLIVLNVCCCMQLNRKLSLFRSGIRNQQLIVFQIYLPKNVMIFIMIVEFPLYKNNKREAINKDNK